MADGIELARVASEAALSTEGVYALGTGLFVEIATYEGSEKVPGVIVTPDEVEIHIVARHPLARPLPELAENIRERVAPDADGRRITVVVEDLEVVEDESL